MGQVKLRLRCPQSFHAITADPQPDWKPDDLISELNSLEQKLQASSLSSLPPTETSSRSEVPVDSQAEKRKRKCETPETNARKRAAFVMRISDDDMKDIEHEGEEDVQDQSLVASTRLTCGELHTRYEFDEYLAVEALVHLMRKSELEEGALFEMNRGFLLHVKDEIRKKISQFSTTLANQINRFSSALIQVEQQTKTRRERDREADMQCQRQLAISSERSLKMVSGAYYIPKHNKFKPLGEDAYFICDEKQTIAVADGIGGWAKKGIDAGEYARELLTNSLIATQNEPRGAVDLKKVLNKAYLKTKAKGSSTACIITLAGHWLSALNVGDSGFTVCRGGKVIYKSPLQQHEFNCPFQLGNERDSPNSAQELKVAVEAGDVIVVGTDGLFDNVSLHEIENVVKQEMESGSQESQPRQIAKALAELALNISKDKSADTPFSREATRSGSKHKGGKTDDITVVVASVMLP